MRPRNDRSLRRLGNGDGHRVVHMRQRELGSPAPRWLPNPRATAIRTIGDARPVPGAWVLHSSGTKSPIPAPVWRSGPWPEARSVKPEREAIAVRVFRDYALGWVLLGLFLVFW